MVIVLNGKQATLIFALALYGGYKASEHVIRFAKKVKEEILPRIKA